MQQQLVLSALVQNHYGVLLRVAGLFSRRGYNIISLTVSETEDMQYSRMTIVASADPSTFRQMEKQLLKLEDVIKVVRLEPEEASTSELLLVKLVALPAERAQLLKTATQYGARVMDVGDKTMTVELTGIPSRLDHFIENIRQFGIVELARTGLTALERGDNSIWQIEG